MVQHGVMLGRTSAVGIVHVRIKSDQRDSVVKHGPIMHAPPHGLIHMNVVIAKDMGMDMVVGVQKSVLGDKIWAVEVIEQISSTKIMKILRYFTLAFLI